MSDLPNLLWALIGVLIIAGPLMVWFISAARLRDEIELHNLVIYARRLRLEYDSRIRTLNEGGGAAGEEGGFEFIDEEEAAALEAEAAARKAA